MRKRHGSSGQKAERANKALQLPPFWREVRHTLGLFVLTAVLLAWLFPPYGLWPLAFVCLVPWTVAVCRTQRAWLVHWLGLFVGWGFFLVALRWLAPITGLGFLALGGYLAVYWTLAGWALRTGRRHGVSVIWTLPVTWVACEFLRAKVMTGFPWLFIGHGLHDVAPLIQISDLGGAYAVSLVALLINGAIAETVLQRWPSRTGNTGRRQFWAGAVAGVVLLVGTVGYGFYRLGEVDHRMNAEHAGPRIAVIQHDFPLRSSPPYGAAPWVVLSSYLSLAAEAAAEKPDLIAFPETVWNAYMNEEYVTTRPVVDEARPTLWHWSRMCHRAVSAFARGDYTDVNAVISTLEDSVRDARERPAVTLKRLPAREGAPTPVLVGSVSVEQFPEATYPKARFYNSALLYDADGTQRPVRYDKQHLVPFGEIVPFREGTFLGIDLHWLYRRLNELSPFSQDGKQEYSLTPGKREPTLFTLTPADGRVYHFGTPICYEDTTPYIVRELVYRDGEKRADFLINISNDGWFAHRVGPRPESFVRRLLWPAQRWLWLNSELPQHLAICQFRAVENRVTIARAVNTGISGFIDPNGRVYSVVATRKGRTFGPGVIGYDLHPVYLDDRVTVYGNYGDVLAWLCLSGACVLWLTAVFERWVLALRLRIQRLLSKSAGRVSK